MGRRINLADGLTARGECGGISIGAASSRATLIDASSTQQRHVVACSTDAPGAQILPDGAAGMADGSLWVVVGGGGAPSTREHPHPRRSSLPFSTTEQSGLWWPRALPMMLLAAWLGRPVPPNFFGTVLRSVSVDFQTASPAEGGGQMLCRQKSGDAHPRGRTSLSQIPWHHHDQNVNKRVSLEQSVAASQHAPDDMSPATIRTVPLRWKGGGGLSQSGLK